MKKTFVNMTAEYYRRRDEELDLFMGSFGRASWPLVVEREQEPVVPFKKLLVVDDESKIRDAYRRIFSRRGFDVLTAANAMEAKDLLVREQVGIIFLDINMAEVNGELLFELIRAFHPDVKVIVSSVYSIEEQKERIKDADAYFDKADDKDALIDMVSVMARGGGGDAGQQELFLPMF